MAYPTVDFGYSTPYVVTFNNTPQPVFITGTVAITGNVTVMNWPTPIYGLGTPAPVYVRTREITPIPVPTNAGGEGGLGVTIGGISGSFDTRNISGVLPTPHGQGQTYDAPGAVVNEQPLGFCLPPGVLMALPGVPACFTFQIWNVDRFSILGVDLLGPLSAITGVLFFVFVARQIQEH